MVKANVLKFFGFLSDFLIEFRDGLLNDIDHILEKFDDHWEITMGSVNELDAYIGESLWKSYETAPLFVVVGFLSLMAVFTLLIMWLHSLKGLGKTENKIKAVGKDSPAKGELVTLYQSKVVLRHLVKQIENFQSNARQQVVKDAMTLAVLNDRINVLSGLLNEAGHSKARESMKTLRKRSSILGSQLKKSLPEPIPETVPEGILMPKLSNHVDISEPRITSVESPLTVQVQEVFYPLRQSNLVERTKIKRTYPEKSPVMQTANYVTLQQCESS